MDPMDWPLSDVISSVPEGKAFRVKEARDWKSGWLDIDWIENFVVYPFWGLYPVITNLLIVIMLTYLAVKASIPIP